LRRTVQAALADLRKEYPEVQVRLSELKTWQEIESYTLILAAPSLVIDEQLVCKGRFPGREEVVDWLRQAREHRLQLGDK
jgi:hypothetical protein